MAGGRVIIELFADVTPRPSQTANVRVELLSSSWQDSRKLSSPLHWRVWREPCREAEKRYFGVEVFLHFACCKALAELPGRSFATKDASSSDPCRPETARWGIVC